MGPGSDGAPPKTAILMFLYPSNDGLTARLAHSLSINECTASINRHFAPKLNDRSE